MITKVITIEELKQMFVEILLGKTDKVTRVSDHSVLNGIAFGAAKVAQKAIKDIALIETHLFPDSAFGSGLDEVAEIWGIPARFGETKSSVYLRIVADPGTVYLHEVCEFLGSNGIAFVLTEDITIDDEGYGYYKVVSRELGSKTNVDPLSINNVSPAPQGHKYVINEFYATGGRDFESDEFFRSRIKNGYNLLSVGTIEMLKQAFISVDERVLNVYFGGIKSGSVYIYVVSQNGVDFTQDDLDTMLEQTAKYFNLSDLRDFDEFTGVILKNVEYDPIDIEIRLEMFNNYDIDEIRIGIQTKISNQLNYNYWNFKNKGKIEIENLISLAKRQRGVKFVSDSGFKINGENQNYYVERLRLPRIRSFLLLDLNGNLISNSTGTLLPYYYPSEYNENVNAIL